MDARTQAFYDQHDAHITDVIRRCRWFIQYVGGDTCVTPGCTGEPDSDEPPFAYTVGLFGLGHPELLIVGVPPATAVGVLNDLGRRIHAGATLLAGELLTFDEWPHRIIPETVPNPGEIVFESNRFYDRPDDLSVPALQLSYDDSEGRFPWDEGYASPWMQPRPGTFTA
ncbi:hypothetical protein MNBD_ACTINO01-688 [hydrothermal vent metagenome]|uniref:DUF4262 domain-containing protein n=1 Tax=hydrothermal vent metagenome TaxID=652676 RepID=A0A3B0SVZ9_9ZZZZ